MNWFNKEKSNTPKTQEDSNFALTREHDNNVEKAHRQNIFLSSIASSIVAICRNEGLNLQDSAGNILTKISVAQSRRTYDKKKGDRYYVGTTTFLEEEQLKIFNKAYKMACEVNDNQEVITFDQLDGNAGFAQTLSKNLGSIINNYY